MKLTRAATYGILAATYLANAPAGKVVSNTIICHAYQMPDRFVLQIRRVLVSAGIVTSPRDCEGGYRLAKPANKITPLGIVEAIDASGDVELAGLSKNSAATVEKALAAIESNARKRLAAVTLADLWAAKAA